MNLAALIAHHARHRGEKPAIEAGDEVLNYADLDLTVRRLAARLRAHGATAGEPIGVLMRDTPMHLAAIVAVIRIGAILLPFDWRWTPAEVERIAGRFRPRVIVADDERRVPPGCLAVGIKDLEATAPDPAPPAALADSPMVYALTSGTTGEPKAIVLTHEEMYGRAVAAWIEYPLLQTGRILLMLPLAYGGGRVWAFNSLCLGATLVMFPGIFDPKELVRAVTERHITVLFVPPNISRALLALEGDGLLMPQLRLYVSGAAGIHPEERRAIRARIAPHVIEFYASTGGGPTAVLREEEEEIAPTSVGRPVLGVQVEIVDENHRCLPPGEIGWVRIRGPGVTTRFVEGGRTTDEGIHDGWYYPGDLGSLDARGLLYLHGRSADLIKRGGLMVYAQEVERVLQTHPAVAEAAVVGVPSPTLGEEVAAFVRLREPTPPAALIAHCRRALAPHKVPTQVKVVDSFPRNANGKVVKAALRGKA
jgi:acyl-CoA synthetase (AMP-forming)/AMP-acid ligase II